MKTYFQTNGVDLERTLELDAMMGTLDLVARSDWVAVLPGLMMASDIEGETLRINPIVDPPMFLDLVAIEPSRRALSFPAAAFHTILLDAAKEQNAKWSAVAFNGPA
jgi:DNA-binding transcriptional LysR family regulator